MSGSYFFNGTFVRELGAPERTGRKSLPSTSPQPAPVEFSASFYLDMWLAIHTAALEDRLTLATLLEITRDLPGCCAGPWAAWLAGHPLPMTGQFAWSVDAHNDVRRRQGKLELTVSQARSEWSDTKRSAVP